MARTSRFRQRLLLIVPLLLLALAPAAVLAGRPFARPLAAQAVGGAPGSPGVDSVWASAEKSFLGTSRTPASTVWFTGNRGVVSEVFYPVADPADTTDLQFLVGDAYAQHPERFHHRPRPPRLPEQAWINPPVLQATS